MQLSPWHVARQQINRQNGIDSYNKASTKAILYKIIMSNDNNRTNIHRYIFIFSFQISSTRCTSSLVWEIQQTDRTLDAITTFEHNVSRRNFSQNHFTICCLYSTFRNNKLFFNCNKLHTIMFVHVAYI